MIGFIKGILKDKDYDNITVECGGVGFVIYVTKSCMSGLPQIDEEVKIYTYLHVREDEMSLYGFVSPEEKRLFLRQSIKYTYTHKAKAYSARHCRVKHKYRYLQRMRRSNTAL